MIGAALLLFVSAANALPNGAPSKACQSLLPQHGPAVFQQDGPSPYGISAVQNGPDVYVSIASPLQISFQGFMLQARIRGGLIGGFFEPIQNDVHTIDCFQPRDTITHNGPQSKPAVQMKWIPPKGYKGPVVFNGTVAQDFSTYWVGVESQPLVIDDNVEGSFPNPENPPGNNPTPPHFFPEESTQANIKADPFYEGCGAKKLCFGDTDNCVSSQNCKAAVVVTVSGDRYEFEMKALNNAKWVGVGLSSDNKMGEDSVIECVQETTTNVKAYLSWTTPRPKLNAVRISNPQKGITLLGSNLADGALYCKVLRDSKTVINDVEFDLINKPYYILVAAGSEIRQNSVGFHDIAYRASSSERFLSDISDVKGASKLLLRLHGAFMLAAWIGTASLGTFIARYYRKTWVGKTICGKDLWFAWHRMFMVATWALTTVAFILIFLELRAWSSESNPHAILGCIVTALCFMQPIAAFFRPHPGTPRRPIFNWVHWLGGNAAHIIAIITIFFAVKLNKSELPKWFDWILVAFVAFHVVMHLLLSIMGCVSDNSSNQRVTAFPMKDLTSSGKMTGHIQIEDAPHSLARKLLFGLYLLVVTALTAALIVVTVLAPIET